MDVKHINISMLNPYFNFRTAYNEQNLVENLVIEAIQIYGMDINYIPKTLVDFNALLGEDPQKAFQHYYTIESYMENLEGFTGMGNFLSKMDLNIDKEAVFVFSKRRFDEEILGLHWQGDWVYSTTYNFNDAVHYLGTIYVNTFPTSIGNPPGSSDDWQVMEQVRPKEGDLIYLPLTHDIFEILFADHEEVFYQLGKIYVWKLTCEKWRANHEVFETGNAEIDAIAAELDEYDGVIKDPISDNETIEHRMNHFLNLDPKNPFGA
jgi:hypothetical protein